MLRCVATDFKQLKSHFTLKSWWQFKILDFQRKVHHDGTDSWFFILVNHSLKIRERNCLVYFFFGRLNITNTYWFYKLMNHYLLKVVSCSWPISNTYSHLQISTLWTISKNICRRHSPQIKHLKTRGLDSLKIANSAAWLR